MKILSDLFLVKFIISFVLIVWVAILIIIGVNTTLSCVDKNNCLRPHCKYTWLKSSYQKIVLENLGSCRYSEINNIKSIAESINSDAVG
jgi:hypothetical protein